jgi:hypothetical protein
MYNDYLFNFSILIFIILLIYFLYIFFNLKLYYNTTLVVILIGIFSLILLGVILFFCNKNDCSGFLSLLKNLIMSIFSLILQFLTSFKDFLLSLFNSFTSFISGDSQLIKDAPSLLFGLLYLASMGLIIYSAYELFNPTQNQSLSSKKKMILMIISFIFFVIFAIQTVFLISSEKTTSIFNIFGPLLFLGSIVAFCYLIYKISKTSSDNSYSIQDRWNTSYLYIFLLNHLVFLV